MIEETASFYREAIAPLVFTSGPEANIKIFPLTRVDFFGGAGLSVGFLVHRVALSALYLAACIFTCFLHQDFRSSLIQNAQEIPKYAAAIPLGFVGAFIPQTINERVLQIPANGLTTRLPQRV